MSQAELAACLNKQQGEVSKIERRDDLRVSTLRDFVQSMGGTLEFVARLPGGVVRVLEIEDQKRDAHEDSDLARPDRGDFP